MPFISCVIFTLNSNVETVPPQRPGLEVLFIPKRNARQNKIKKTQQHKLSSKSILIAKAK